MRIIAALIPLSALLLGLPAVAAAPAVKPAPKLTPAPKATPGPKATPIAPVPTPSLAATPAPATPARLPATANGVIRDAVTGDPIAGALVQQEGSITSVFTQPDGHFRLMLERNGSSQVTVAATGFEDQKVAIGDGKALDVRLHEISGFLPAAPLVPLVPVGLSAAETAPLNSGLMFTYGLRNNALNAPGGNGANASITGWSNNDFRLGARFRWKPWLLEAEGEHFEEPVDLAGIAKADNPAFKPSTYQAGARVGLFTGLGPDLEVAAMAAYRWTNTVPNNNDIPFTGSNLDFEQTRHALGGELLGAWRPGRGRWHLELGGGYYPLVYAFADSPGTPFAQNNLVDAHAILGYELTPGFRLGVGGVLERWSGTGDDQAVKLIVGAHYTPGGVPKGNE